MFREEYQLRNNEQQEDFYLGLNLEELNCRKDSKSSQLHKPLPFENSPNLLKKRDLLGKSGDCSRRTDAIRCLSECSFNIDNESNGYIQQISSHYAEIDPNSSVVTHPELFQNMKMTKNFKLKAMFIYSNLLMTKYL